MCQDCEDVAKIYNLNINQLFQDLAIIKGQLKGKVGQLLSEKEQFYLCLSLFGYEPLDIANIEEARGLFIAKDIQKRTRNIRKFMTETINVYIKFLIEKSQDTIVQKELKERGQIIPWLRILSFLLNNGYKNQLQGHRLMIEVSCEGKINPQDLANLLTIFSQELGQNTLNIKEIS